MKRDLARLAGPRFDLLVVGAGIYGACVARDAALRGLRVAIIDRADFGGATSHNSFKLIHGGLRYLQHLDLARVRQSLAERRFWLRAAAHLIRPLRFVIPTYGHGSRGREALWCALRMYDLLGFDRNRELPPSQRVPPGRVLSRDELFALIPGLSGEGVTGGVTWYDGQMEDADRVLVECLLDAADAGAEVANYVAAAGFLGDEARLQGVRARDLLAGDEFEIRAALTVNCAGPWIAELLRVAPRPLATAGIAGFAKGMNLVTRRLLGGEHAVGVASARRSDAVVGESARLYFITPWAGQSAIGTADLPYDGPPDGWRITEADVLQFIAEINAAYPAARLGPEDVRYCYGGLSPAEGQAHRQVRLSRQALIRDHAQSDAVDGLISVLGVKYTTARLVAERVVDLALRKLGRRGARCETARRPLPGARGLGDPAALERELRAAPGVGADAAAVALLKPYGAAYRPVLERAPQTGSAVERVFRAACLHAVRHEMAVRLRDLVLHRSTLAAREGLPLQRLEWCAEMMARELGWTEQRKAAELEAAGMAAQDRYVRLWPAGEPRPAA
jgi:glycerol-3-phosphate dehydrogenase